MLPFLSLQLHIEKLVYGGEGLSRLDGEVVFTPFVLPGETVEADRTEARKHVQRTRLLQVDDALAGSRRTPLSGLWPMRWMPVSARRI